MEAKGQELEGDHSLHLEQSGPVACSGEVILKEDEPLVERCELCPEGGPGPAIFFQKRELQSIRAQREGRYGGSPLPRVIGEYCPADEGSGNQ